MLVNTSAVHLDFVASNIPRIAIYINIILVTEQQNNAHPLQQARLFHDFLHRKLT